MGKKAAKEMTYEELIEDGWTEDEIEAMWEPDCDENGYIIGFDVPGDGEY